MLYLVELKGEFRILSEKKKSKSPNHLHIENQLYFCTWPIGSLIDSGILGHQEPPKETEQGCLQNFNVGSKIGVIALGISVTFIK